MLDSLRDVLLLDIYTRPKSGNHRFDFNLHNHAWNSQLGHINACPDGLVVRHPFSELLNYEVDRF